MSDFVPVPETLPFNYPFSKFSRDCVHCGMLLCSVSNHPGDMGMESFDPEGYPGQCVCGRPLRSRCPWRTVPQCPECIKDMWEGKGSFREEEAAKRNREHISSDASTIKLLAENPDLHIDIYGQLNKRKCRTYRHKSCVSFGAHILMCDCDEHINVKCHRGPGCEAYQNSV